MAKLIVGLILLVAPFLLVSLFKNKNRGFVYTLFFLIIFHTFLAFFTQLFGVFYYGVILAANFLAVLILLIMLGRKFSASARPASAGLAQSSAIFRLRANLAKSPAGYAENFLPRVDWIFFIVAIISILTLYQVHYNYTGKFNMVNDVLFQYHQAKNMKYVYPYFSDEWYAVSLIKESINNHSLPLKNPFDNSFFPNMEMFFHSFLAEVMLFLGLDPLTQYTALSIFINTLIILLAYLFLRINNVSKLASAIPSLFVLYITSASNLPGIWHLIPVTMGIVMSLIGFCFLSLDNFEMAALSFLPVVLFYPPLFVFYGIGLLGYLFSSPRIKEKIFEVIKSLIILFSAVIALYVVLMLSPLAGAINYIFSNLFYRSFTGDFMPQFNFYNIIPWPVVLLAVFGLYFVYKNKKWLFFQLILGVIFWIFYAFSPYRIVIGYERVVFFTSIIVALISGFGIEEIKKHVNLKYIETGVVVLFLLLIPFYTQGENWRELVLSNSLIRADSIPMAPANNYLTDEDLRIFKNIKQKKFFSIPWKGTVIGIATSNYPVVTKGGTITMDPKNPAIYQQFMDSSCDKKLQIAKERNVDYIYSMPFFCPNFQEIDKSSEGFVLYKVQETQGK